MPSRKKAPASEISGLDDDKDYNFKLVAPYQLGRFLLNVMDSYTAKGSFIKTIPAEKLGDIDEVVLPQPE